MERRLAAIMVADIVGYSSLMESAEEQTADAVARCQELIREKVSPLGGRVFNTAGDACLAEFSSAINALRGAAEIRNALASSSDGDPLKLRIGLHLADVVVRGDDLVGDGVNVATRIQQEAEPDSICVSGVFFDNIRRNSPFIFEDLGTRCLKNLSNPLRIYRLREESARHRLQTAPTRTQAIREKRPCSVAVLPLRVMGGDEDQRFLAEGLTDELIVELARFRRLFVSSRSASFAIADANPDPVKVGSTLGVRYVLEGQVRKISDQVRINLTLTETDGGSVVWSDKVARPFADLLDLLDRTAAKIAATVFGRMEDASMITARRKQPENMSAFECVLRGIDHHRLGGVLEEHSREAVEWFTRAIELDPNYAAAYAWRVCAASDLPEFSFPESEPDIRRALELDPCDAEANRIASFFELLKSDFDQAAMLMRRAMELNPSDAYIKARCAAVSTFMGEGETSLRLLEEAEALDPLLPVWCIEEHGIAYYALGRYEEALEALGKLVFQTFRSRLYRAAALMALGRPEDASKLVKEAIASKPNFTVSRFLFQERYRDPLLCQQLRDRLEDAGLPS
ncbi:adenylate/guanylate cyclase domain-containing protein [Microvirga brassicacearum]|uniref:Adenylate/guanylate cyclase domain-containing protein n=1 Tax=Microvirga brassicacearum TaxID=2580413 RepID=A0A5N3P7J2_9HYPH|nr:adenylate/guanylate cyclase domain-containing protein [Microvirga brassicacearum]KAB0265697.1 adenylate/guanylate cyclase domain-containing protein [Microvirga brassicacearum]